MENPLNSGMIEGDSYDSVLKTITEWMHAAILKIKDERKEPISISHSITQRYSQYRGESGYEGSAIIFFK